MIEGRHAESWARCAGCMQTCVHPHTYQSLFIMKRPSKSIFFSWCIPWCPILFVNLTGYGEPQLNIILEHVCEVFQARLACESEEPVKQRSIHNVGGHCLICWRPEWNKKVAEGRRGNFFLAAWVGNQVYSSFDWHLCHQLSRTIPLAFCSLQFAEDR
jgi:hypothetical protein